MATSGTKNVHFLCQMKMESEVACAHSVTITATAGLTIDKVGGVGAELGYTYPAGQGLIAQDVGILPTTCGGGKLFAAITSPYFATPSGLKIKRDVIDIQVECAEPSGIYGTYAGVALDSTQGGQVSPSLYIIHNSAGAGEFLTGTPASDGLLFSALIYTPSGGVVFKGPSLTSAQIQCTEAGVYRIQFFEPQVVSASAGILPNRTYQYFDGRVSLVTPVATKTVKRRGTKFAPVTPIGQGLGPFSGSIPLVDTWHPYGSVSAAAAGSPPTSVENIIATITINADGSASGSWLLSGGGAISIAVTRSTGGTFFMQVNQG